MDFTSALYLGMEHPSDALRPWDRLTTGRPAALCTPSAGRWLADGLAGLLGCERVTLARSTLHGFVDVVAALVGPADALVVDAGSYPVSQWAVACSPVPSVAFAHHDASALTDQLRTGALKHRRPMVVVDGWCPGCGGAAPIGDYLRLVKLRGGRLVVDDTQAVGVLGSAPNVRRPYGRGGGGTPAWAGVYDHHLILVSSLAKGFGVPMAVIGGPLRDVERVLSAGPTASHSSTPSAADLRAAEHALAVNRDRGDSLRQRLVCLVRRLRRRAGHLGVRLVGGLFPVQSLPAMNERAAAAVHRHLSDLGMGAVLQRSRCRRGATVTLLVTARHRPGEMDRAAEVLAAALGAASGRRALRRASHHATT